MKEHHVSFFALHDPLCGSIKPTLSQASIIYTLLNIYLSLGGIAKEFNYGLFKTDTTLLSTKALENKPKVSSCHDEWIPKKRTSAERPGR